MTVIGIDYDSDGVFLALVDENTGAYVSEWRADLACGPGDAFQRARRVRRLLPTRSQLERFGVAGGAIELPFSKYAASLVPQLRVQGAIVATLDWLDLVEIRPQRWKSEAVGKSNATKAEIRAWALEQGCPRGLPQDTYDAYAIARAHLAIGERKEQAA